MWYGFNCDVCISLDFLRAKSSRQDKRFPFRGSNHLPPRLKSVRSLAAEASWLGTQKSEVRYSDQFEARYRSLGRFLLLIPLLVFSSIDLFGIDEAVWVIVACSLHSDLNRITWIGAQWIQPPPPLSLFHSVYFSIVPSTFICNPLCTCNICQPNTLQYCHDRRCNVTWITGVSKTRRGSNIATVVP